MIGKFKLPEPVDVNKEFSHNPLYQAMLHAGEQLDRCQINFIVLGEAAHAVYFDHPLKGFKVVFGVMQRHAVPNLVSVLKVLEPTLEMMTDGWKFTYERVPVYCKIITKNYRTLTDPDIRFYGFDSWRIPNPFLEYWKCENHYDI